jgi:hypothetical protein
VIVSSISIDYSETTGYSNPPHYLQPNFRDSIVPLSTPKLAKWLQRKIKALKN